MEVSVIYSAIQPTGRLHLGNYLGAVRQWIKIQRSFSPSKSCGESSSGTRPMNTTIIYGLADMHSMTQLGLSGSLESASSFISRESLTSQHDNLNCLSSNNTVRMAAELLALGLDPTRVILKRNSRILEHANLGWVLSCIAPVGRLKNMTQFKIKSKIKSDDLSNRDPSSLNSASDCANPNFLDNFGLREKNSPSFRSAHAGLLYYPILQAADILLYRAKGVPVGQDQWQHLEFARELAKKFNETVQVEYFPLPVPFDCPYLERPQKESLEDHHEHCGEQPASLHADPARGLHAESASHYQYKQQREQLEMALTRLKSLNDPTKKMSKSDPDEYSRIHLVDPPDLIRLKVKKALTDSFPTVSFDPLHRPALSNLIAIYYSLLNEDDIFRADQVQTGSQSDALQGDPPIGFPLDNLLGFYNRQEMPMVAFKRDLTDLIVGKLTPFQRRYKELSVDLSGVQSVLEAGEERARQIASKNYQDILSLLSL